MNVSYRRTSVPALAMLFAAALATGCGHLAPELSEPAASRPAAPEPDPNVLEGNELVEGVTSIAEMIEGRIPGVEVRRRGNRVWVEMRGQGTINGSNEALIIIDGVQSSSIAFLGLNPKDVARIEALKGASAAVYGMRGANGVLVVTTRRR